MCAALTHIFGLPAALSHGRTVFRHLRPRLVPVIKCVFVGLLVSVFFLQPLPPSHRYSTGNSAAQAPVAGSSAQGSAVEVPATAPESATKRKPASRSPARSKPSPSPSPKKRGAKLAASPSPSPKKRAASPGKATRKKSSKGGESGESLCVVRAAMQ
jgi:hypothetical protein